MTQVEYAEHRGIGQSRVSRLVSRGKIPHNCIKKISGRKLIDRDKADAALAENLDQIMNKPTRQYGKKKKPAPAEMEQTTKAAGTKGMSMADAQKLQAQYKAAILKLDYEERTGKLILAASVDKDFFDIARLTRDAILNIPDRISAELASITDTHVISEKLTVELTQALEELSRG